jgi:coenzyme PQQ precursor peptide PqqA
MAHGDTAAMEDPMAWTKPRVTEVSLALEINSYACAEIG